MDMMTRRRAMMGAVSGPLPEWDFEWDAEDKVTLANSGFTVSGNGTQSEAWGSTSLWVTAKGTSSYRRYNYPQAASLGVLQARYKHSNANAYFRWCFGNGSSMLAIHSQYSTNYKGIFLYDDTSVVNMTKIVTINNTHEYEIRLVHKGTSGDVYLDDVKIASDLDLSTLLVPFGDEATKGFQYGVTSSSSITNNLYTLKMKFDRT